MVCYKLGESHFLLVLTCLWLWLWWSTRIHVIAAYHSLRPGDTLNSTTELCSENDKYCLGFSQFSSAHNSTYLRIYAKGKGDWNMWIGNRNQPLDMDSAVLSLSHSGVLKIESKDMEPIILYSSTQPSNNTVATLMNTSNFVLQRLQPGGTESTVLWQSFDYPTDKLLPGMKLGVNHKTGRNWSLVSSMGYANPALGAFRLEWEPRRRELLIKQRGQLCWTSGELGKNIGFMHNTHYMIVSNDDESYFTITTLNEELTRWELLKTGQLINRNGDDNVARADMCYGYNTDGGCQKWEDIPFCRNPGDAFELKEVYLNLNLKNFLANSSYSPSDCRDTCWKNCSCDGFTDYYDDGTGCIFVYLNLTEGADFASGGEKFYILVKNTHHKGTKKWIWISILIVAALFSICAFILYLALKKRKLRFEDKNRKEMEINKMEDLATSNRFYDARDPEDEFKKRQDLKVFSYTSVLLASNDFSTENKLGQGGFGPVYKGIQPNGQEVAIKRLSKTSSQGTAEFKNELMLIGELQHMNLVQLLGYCIHGEERILIYEYMHNKSLDFYLFEDGTRSKLLDWKKRFNIIEGISQGLLYLHKYSRLKVIHRDLKASNILLDENMNPKISDFGLARMFTRQESTTNTSRIVGTYGYMSPEYAMEGVFSVKSDVYSFGVLLLEIVSGRRNTSFYDGDRFLNLIGHAWELWNEGACLKLIDPSLTESPDLDEVQRCIHIGLLCVEQNANNRPLMSQIISMLSNKNPITLPQRPAFYFGSETFDGIISSTEFCTDSTKAITTSREIESR
ncbi:hypothetical protein JHK84_043358 [Glycine max]|nr:hypothetical protein JHK86_043168 [Glycine max]KAG4957429.1 hypothetical protein JHK85_043809 [Glycine max]KAG5117245.1 hypothetical protein JHK84_043358 [Glycine max]